MIFFATGCTEKSVSPIDQITQAATSTFVNSADLQTTKTNVPVSTVEPKKMTIWVDPEIENHPYIENLEIPAVSLVEKQEKANYWIETKQEDTEESTILYEEFFVISVPFIDQTKNIVYENLKNIWVQDSQNEGQILWIYPDDEKTLKNIFNENPGKQVIVSDEKPEECKVDLCWHLVNFQKTDPEWRIVAVDDQSLVNSDFDSGKYQLVSRIYLNQNENLKNEMKIPFSFERKTNFDPSLLTSVLMTGTTALVRNIAAQIEQYGVDFPLQNLRWLFDSTDIIHVSNEVSFYSKCPPAIPVRKEMRFCSDPGYIEVLKLMGVDVVELTGNHLLDWGPDAFLETLAIYEKNGIQTYGGGRTIEEAEKPLIIEHNGNKIAFLGCNLPGPDNNWVADDRPGSLSCNLDELADTISSLKSQGINPIFTFQHNEFNTFKATQQMRADFWMMADAGAVIVSGSQAHYPQGIDFVNSAFIHYGLGNFLFDQMYTYWAMATIDVHYFYENRYINTHQYPIINENYGQPRLMNEEEASLLFEKIYTNSFYYLAESP
jgi:poly-gamma-glutamate synthesis protein (capsule biosynthesis protein)